MIRIGLALLLILAGVTPAWSQEIDSTSKIKTIWHHGLSLSGTLKYPADFTHVDYVNPEAPKGGRLRLSAQGTFDSLNAFTIRGQVNAYVGLIYDSLMQATRDESSSQYGLLAEAVSYPRDYSSVTYRLRKGARWHDGQPVTPRDVIFSFNTLIKQNPLYNRYYVDVERVEKTGEREVSFYFSRSGNRELPYIIGQFPIAPHHYWSATDARGEPRDISKTTLDLPLGSGPYRVKTVDVGARITLERVDDYWGKDLPINRGHYNFGKLSVDYFRDSTLAFEAFKADAYDVRIENVARNWVEGYDFAAALDGRVKRRRFVLKQAEPMNGFVFNLRRDQFADRRVRRAFNHIFDFEWTNKNIFYGLYKRTRSFFQNSKLSSSLGAPQGRVRELLEPHADALAPEVLSTAFTNPQRNDQSSGRDNFRIAHDLLREAGWEIRDGVLTQNETGAEMRVTFLLSSANTTYERILLPYKQNLKRLGIIFNIRLVDPTQYQNRLQDFDFDMTLGGWQQSLSPGNEQRDFWSRDAADRRGSRNYMGLKNPAIDALIDHVIFASDGTELIAASHALDRALQWEQFIIPLWHDDGINVAWWNRFGYQEPPPDYNLAISSTWWSTAP